MTTKLTPQMFIGWLPVRQSCDRDHPHVMLHEFGYSKDDAIDKVTSRSTSYDFANPVVRYERVKITVEVSEV